MPDGVILVTGGAGYIGSHVTLALLDAGWRVVALDDLSTGSAAALPEQVELVRADVQDAAALAALFGRQRILAVAHLAAVSSVPAATADPARCAAVNVVGTQTLLDAAHAAGVQHFLLSSTASVYGEPGAAHCAERMPTAPINCYAASKVEAEQALAASPVAGVALRYFNVAGADPAGRAGDRRPGSTHLIKSALECAAGLRDALPVYGTDHPTPDGSCVRDYVHVADIATAHALALRHLLAGHPGGVFNLGSGRGFSVLEIVECVRRVSGTDFPIRRVSRREGDMSRLVADIQKAQSVLGFAPERSSLDAIVSDAWRWELRAAPAPS